MNSETYGGSQAFSEPESKAHRDHLQSLENKRAYLTYHSFAQFIIYPYSYLTSHEAENRQELASLANDMTRSIGK